MRHYGDITKLSGYGLPVVDIITGGSPCQDLSVAGKRAGLAGERSGLFMEQVRIVKEMRERDARDTGRTGWAVRPRYMVWENVPGAFSSNGGKDFQAVLEEIVRIVEDEVPDLSTVVQGGWTKSGCLYDEMGAWSVAWRVHDAQFWGVPQRRKRIALVADFGGLSAPEILFERKGMSGDSEPGGEERQGTPARTKDGSGSTICLQGNGIDRADTAGCNGRGWCEDVSYTLNTIDRPAVYEPILLESNQNHATVQTDGISTALPASMGMGGGYVPMVVGCDVYNQEVTGEVAAVLTAASGGTNTSGPKVMVAGFKSGQGSMARSIGYEEEKAPTLSAAPSGTNQVPAVFENHSQDSRYKSLGDICETVSAKYGTGGNNMPMVVEPTTYQKTTGCLSPGAHPGSYNGQDAYNDMLIAAVDCRNGTENNTTNGTLQAKSTGGIGVNFQNVCREGSTVRRLTPLECERLQGYPDGWTDIGEWIDSKGKKHKEADSPRYKALGNSIALPFWAYLARRICAQYERTSTMASLFDGIGGFPLVFSRAGAVPVWASEIEEFCVAVTKARFGDK